LNTCAGTREFLPDEKAGPVLSPGNPVYGLPGRNGNGYGYGYAKGKGICPAEKVSAGRVRKDARGKQAILLPGTLWGISEDEEREGMNRPKGEKTVKKRLEYLRGEIEAERISYGEIAELQSLTKYIEPGDVLLLEWAGVPERRNNG
jgi:hypothetical protein